MTSHSHQESDNLHRKELIKLWAGMVSTHILGVLFLFSGITKIITWPTFLQVVIIPLNNLAVSTVVSTAIISIELAIGWSLLSGHKWMTSGVLLCAITVSLTLVYTVLWTQGMIEDCGCFGGLLPRSSLVLVLIRNTTIVIAGAFVVYLGSMQIEETDKATHVGKQTSKGTIIILACVVTLFCGRLCATIILAWA